MRGSYWVSGLCMAMAAACSSTEEPPRMSPGRELFENNVMPIVGVICADCHSNPNDDHDAPDFLDTEDGQYYESLVARVDFVGCDVQNSLLLIKGLHAGHPGGKLTDPQQTKVNAWLTQEAMDRFNGVCAGAAIISGAGGGGAVPEILTGKKAIEQFGACMTIDDWKNTGMPLVGETLALEGNTNRPCYSCHETDGGGGNWMSNPNAASPDQSIAETFGKMRVPYSIYHLVQWTVNDADASFKDIVQSNRWRDKGKDEGHPTYDLSVTSQGYIDDWFNITYNKWKNGLCSP